MGFDFRLHTTNPNLDDIEKFIKKQDPELWAEFQLCTNKDQVLAVIDTVYEEIKTLPMTRSMIQKRLASGAGYVFGVAMMLHFGGSAVNASSGTDFSEIKTMVQEKLDSSSLQEETKYISDKITEEEPLISPEKQMIEVAKLEVIKTIENTEVADVSPANKITLSKTDTNTVTWDVEKKETHTSVKISLSKEAKDKKTQVSNPTLTPGDSVEFQIKGNNSPLPKTKSSETIEYLGLKQLNTIESIPKNTSIVIHPESVKNLNQISTITFPPSLKSTIQQYPTYSSFSADIKERIHSLGKTVENFFVNEYDILRSTYHQRPRVISFDLLFAFAAIESKWGTSSGFSQNNIFNIQWKGQSTKEKVKGIDYSQDYNTGKKTAKKEVDFVGSADKEEAIEYFLEYIKENRYYGDHLKNSSDQENPYMASAILKTGTITIDNSSSTPKPELTGYSTDVLKISCDTENLEKFRYIFTGEIPKQIFITVPPAGLMKKEIQRSVDEYFKKELRTLVSKKTNITELTSNDIVSTIDTDAFIILPNGSKMYKIDVTPKTRISTEQNLSIDGKKKKIAPQKKVSPDESKDTPHSFDFEDWLESIETVSHELKGKTVILDPGHGGIDGGGAPYTKNGLGEDVRLIESAIALDFCYRAAKLIKEKGGDVHITHYSHARGISNAKDLKKVDPDTDIYSDTEKSWGKGAGKTIKSRKNITNEILKQTENESYFFSIHADVAKDLQLPMIAYFYKGNLGTDKKSKEFAKSLTKQMKKQKGLGKGAKSRGQGLGVVNPSNDADFKALIELGNMQNSKNAWNMRTATGRQQYVDVLINALINHLEK